ncbi:unnamed protein product [Sphagnum balticum]
MAKKLVAAELRTRTEFMKNDTHVDHTPLYLMAAFLSPALNPYLPELETKLAIGAVIVRMKVEPDNR